MIKTGAQDIDSIHPFCYYCVNAFKLVYRWSSMNLSFDHTDDMMRLLDGVRDPVRMQIILLLGQSKAMNVTDIAARFRISRPAISHHLKVLKDAGILRSEKLGQEVFYRLDAARVIAALRQIADTIENCCPPE
jgi:DNA-binding transcriptional ArsR family regulator